MLPALASELDELYTKICFSFFYNKVWNKHVSDKQHFPADSVAKCDMWLSLPDMSRRSMPHPGLSFKSMDICSFPLLMAWNTVGKQLQPFK